MSVTIRPAKIAGPHEPHAGCEHKWRSIGAHVIHLGSKRVPRKYRVENEARVPDARDRPYSTDFQEIREVLVCDVGGDGENTARCKEVLVKIHHQVAFRWGENVRPIAASTRSRRRGK